MLAIHMIGFVLELAKLLIIGYVFCDMKINFSWFSGIPIIFFYMLFVELGNKKFLSIVACILIIIFIWFQGGGGRKKRTVDIIKIYLCASFFDVFLGAFLKLLISGYSKETLIVITNILAIFAVVAIYGAKRKFWKKDVRKNYIISQAVVFSCIVIMGICLFMVVSVLEIAEEYVQNSKLAVFTKILTMILLISILLLVLFVVYFYEANQEIKRILGAEKFLRDTQKNHYEMMLQKEEDTRKFRHDFMNHLLCIREIIVQRQEKKAIAYIDKLQQGMLEIQNKCYSVGNLVIDAIMNYYMQMLDDEIIKLVSGKCSNEIGISQVELCIIFSNLMKNAVEEIERQKDGEKCLKIEISEREEGIKFEISNSTDRGKECFFGTAKKDKKNHGIGLQNVMEIVEKNCGVFQYRLLGATFKVLVILPKQMSGR